MVRGLLLWTSGLIRCTGGMTGLVFLLEYTECMLVAGLLFLYSGLETEAVWLAAAAASAMRKRDF